MTTWIRSRAQTSPLLFFSISALGLGWIVALPLVLSPAGLGLISTEPPELWLALVCVTPWLAALWTQWLAEGNLRVATVGSPWWRVLAGMVLGMVIAMLACAIVPALLLANGAVGQMHWGALLAGSVAWWSNPFNLLGGPLTEEPGWRGYALPHFQTRFGPHAGSLLLGLLWSLWHLPLFFVKGYLTLPVWAFALTLVCLSVLMTWVVNRSRGSVLPAILMHAVFNSSFPTVVGLVRGLPTREPGLTWYLVGIVATTVVVVMATRGRLGAVAR